MTTTVKPALAIGTAVAIGTGIGTVDQEALDRDAALCADGALTMQASKYGQRHAERPSMACFAAGRKESR